MITLRDQTMPHRPFSSSDKGKDLNPKAKALELSSETSGGLGAAITTSF